MAEDTNNENGSDIADVEFAEVNKSESSNPDEVSKKNLELLYDIGLLVNVELGRTSLSIKDLLSLGPGSVIELDRQAGASVDLTVNGILIGKGDVVVINDNFGLRIKEIISPEDRLKSI